MGLFSVLGFRLFVHWDQWIVNELLCSKKATPDALRHFLHASTSHPKLAASNAAGYKPWLINCLATRATKYSACVERIKIFVKPVCHQSDFISTFLVSWTANAWNKQATCSLLHCFNDRFRDCETGNWLSDSIVVHVDTKFGHTSETLNCADRKRTKYVVSLPKSVWLVKHTSLTGFVSSD
jgi:hypothetical protein